MHVHFDKRKDLSGFNSRVLHYEIPSIGFICEMVKDEWAATSDGAVREKGFTNMAGDSILPQDEVQRIVLNMTREVKNGGE